MSQFPKPTVKAPSIKTRKVNLNATVSAPGSPRAKTFRRTMAPGPTSSGASTSTSAPSSLDVSVRSASRSSSSTIKSNKDLIRLSYIEYIIARGMEAALDIEGDKRAKKLTDQLLALEINDDEIYATLNEYEMRIKEVKAFTEVKKIIEKQIENINCQLEFKDKVMENLELVHGKLGSMDKLTVRNIQTNEEEWNVLKSLMEECDQIIHDLMRNCKDFHTILEIKKNIDEFTNLSNVFSKQLQTTYRELELLEADVIKTIKSRIK